MHNVAAQETSSYIAQTFHCRHIQFSNIPVHTLLIHTVFPLCTEYKVTIQLKDGMNTLGLVVFAMAFGVMLGTIGPRAQVAIELFNVRPLERAVPILPNPARTSCIHHARHVNYVIRVLRKQSSACCGAGRCSVRRRCT